MNKKLLIVAVGLLIIPLYLNEAHAGSSRYALAAKAGTLGLGVEGTIKLSEKFNARVGVNAFSYDTDWDKDDINYDADIQLSTVAALIDWHPFGGSFRLTGGAMLNGNEVEADAKLNKSITIGDTIYTPGDVGNLKADIDFNSVAPYLGMGWGNAIGKNKRLTISFELGVLFQGSPEVDLSTDSALVSQSDLQKEEDNLQDEIDKYEYYPVAALSLSYHF